MSSRVTTSLYALSLHASELTVGALIALYALFPMLLAVPIGRMIDRVGIAKPMIAGSILMALGSAVPSFWSGLPVLYLSAIWLGSGFLLIYVSVQHAAGAMSSHDTRTETFSWLALGFSVSSFFGPIVAGFVIDHLGHNFAYAISSGFAVLTFFLILFGGVARIKLPQHDNRRKSGSVLDLVRDPEMRRIYLISVLLGAAWDLFNFVMPIHGTHLGFSASRIGLILGCFSAATFAVRLAMPWISRRFSEWQVLTTALGMAMLCYALLPFMHESWTIMLVTATLGLALGSSQPNVLTLLHHASPIGRAGEAVGVRVTMSNACQVALPLAFGAAGATLGLFAVFWGMGAMIGTGVPLAWRKAFEKPALEG